MLVEKAAELFDLPAADRRSEPQGEGIFGK
jgi:hypothetical protein